MSNYALFYLNLKLGGLVKLNDLGLKLCDLRLSAVIDSLH